ncbi:MAG: hypothetical protein IJU40_07605 [Desulfovibrionaceae bacterium]|nr:hypothetical protein [Desulfovibrionaceae bacterium]
MSGPKNDANTCSHTQLVGRPKFWPTIPPRPNFSQKKSSQVGEDII